jgi:serine/threonine protein kinase
MSRNSSLQECLALAARLGYLSTGITELIARGVPRDLSPAAWLLKSGRINSEQADILETLLHPSDLVPGYELLDLLGVGGMGVVYRARQNNLNRLVAVKTVQLNQADSSFFARFEQEAQTVARLQHPNIITAIDFGQHDGRLFFVMELIQGEDVESFVQRSGRIDERMSWLLMRQVAAGLAHAAESGVVHRDIKPANLLLVNPPAGFPFPAGLKLVKIADFGLALLKDKSETATRLTVANTVIGSPQYMAPEQLSSSKVDLRADIYSLGATTFHVLTGAPPFSGTWSQVLAKKLQQPTPRLGDTAVSVSGDTATLVEHMMHHSPDERPRDYADLLYKIDRVLQAIEPSTTGRTDTAIRQPAIAATEVIPRTEVFTRTDANPHADVIPRTPARTMLPRRWILAATACVVGGGLAAAGWQRLRSHRRTVDPSEGLKPTDWSAPLFSGTLDEWLPYSGEWQSTNDEEGARVIAGKQGIIRRELLRDDQPLNFYRLSLAVKLHQASAVEVQFGVEAAEQLDAPRIVVRLTSDTVEIAERLSDSGTPQTEIQSDLEPWGADRFRSIRIERLRQNWRVLVNGRELGGMAISSRPQLAEFRLAVEQGPAWFGDVEVLELQ